MVLKVNKYYWEESLRNPEPVVDEYYIFDEVIVSDTNLMQKIERLRELIISYCVVTEKNHAASRILDEIYDIVTSVDKIQYTEFVAFWKVLDLSYSVFNQLPNQKSILNEILKKYCEKRRKLYDRLGYTYTTVQALFDSGASRRKGSSGIGKLVNLLKNIIGAEHVKTIEEFVSVSAGYFLPDTGDEMLFEEFCKKFGIEYAFGRKHQQKLPDLVFKADDHLFVVEGKHVKEPGGAQNKQVLELIEFVKHSERSSNIHYVSFMDGMYFNYFISTDSNSNNKTARQRKDIERALASNKNNYFVNTAGFIRLLKDLTGTK